MLLSRLERVRLGSVNDTRRAAELHVDLPTFTPFVARAPPGPCRCPQRGREAVLPARDGDRGGFDVKRLEERADLDRMVALAVFMLTLGGMVIWRSRRMKEQ